MELIWNIEQADIDAVQAFVKQRYGNALVRRRMEVNSNQPPRHIQQEDIWETLVSCLLSSQQRSGPDAPIVRFMALKPFPLSLTACRAHEDIENLTRESLTRFGGIRFSNRIADQLARNFALLENGLWPQVKDLIAQMHETQTVERERSAAIWIQAHLLGFGPKQSRNLLQELGLTRYEIPIDSRITKWLNRFGFPIQLSAGPLADEAYYTFFSDGIQALCREAALLPCVLDAAIFVSFDDN